jgi:hypothetical protein
MCHLSNGLAKYQITGVSRCCRALCAGAQALPMAVMLKFPDRWVCGGFVAAALFGGLAIERAMAADVQINRTVAQTTVQRHEPVTVLQDPHTRMVPYCLEMPTWFFGRPVLLQCAPRYYFKPDTVGTLDEVKALDPKPKPYLEIRPTYP